MITPLIKSTRNHIRESGGVFSISSLVKILMASLISCLTLNQCLNMLAYRRNIFGKSWVIFGNVRKQVKVMITVREFIFHFSLSSVVTGQVQMDMTAIVAARPAKRFKYNYPVQLSYNRELKQRRRRRRGRRQVKNEVKFYQ